MRRYRCKLVLVTFILLATILATHLYTRRSEYSTDSLNGSVVTHSNKIVLVNQTDGSPAPVLVAILAYIHTGSSYTGSIFKQHPGTFYFYEPLKSLVAASRTNSSTRYLNGTIRQLSGDWIREDVAAETVHNLLNCQHDKLDVETLNDITRKVIKEAVIRHLTSPVSIAKKSYSDRTIQECLPLFTNSCLRANLRAFKFIRLPMRPVLGLLLANSNLKFVYLVRDPRAMLDSQVRKNDMGSGNLKRFLVNCKRICTKMHEDFKIYNSFPQSIRDRIKLVRYEDLTDSPMTVMSQIFKFTNIVMLEEDRTFVAKSTRKGNNSFRYELDVWRTHISQVHIDVVNKYCLEVYEDFGYLRYADLTNIRNFEMPTYTKYQGSSIFVSL